MNLPCVAHINTHVALGNNFSVPARVVAQSKKF